MFLSNSHSKKKPSNQLASLLLEADTKWGHGTRQGSVPGSPFLKQSIQFSACTECSLFHLHQSVFIHLIATECKISESCLCVNLNSSYLPDDLFVCTCVISGHMDILGFPWLSCLDADKLSPGKAMRVVPQQCSLCPLPSVSNQCSWLLPNSTSSKNIWRLLCTMSPSSKLLQCLSKVILVITVHSSCLKAQGVCGAVVCAHALPPQ